MEQLFWLYVCHYLKWTRNQGWLKDYYILENSLKTKHVLTKDKKNDITSFVFILGVSVEILQEEKAIQRSLSSLSS